MLKQYPYSQLLIISLFVSAAGAQTVPSTKSPIPVNVYSDIATGLSFQYPIAWKQVKEPGGIFGSSVFVSPGVAASGVPIRAAVQFSAENNSYSKTTLESIGFLYGIVSSATADSCRKIITEVDADATPRTIHGMTYTYGKSGDAGMSQTLSSQIYSTRQGTTCYVFEEDFNQTNGIVRKGQRELTKAESASLQAGLDNIITTVHFADSPTAP